MISRLNRPQGSNCSGVTRRHFLQAGSLFAGGLSLADVLRQRALASPATGPRLNTSVIQIVLCGGPSQHDTFDPKPEAPLEVRGPFNPIETAVPGIRISELFPQLARLMDQCSILRSVHHGDGSHHHSSHWMQTGYFPENLQFYVNSRPSSGAVTARYRGANQPGLPPFVSLPGGPSYEHAAYLGARYSPFEVGDPNKPEFNVPNLALAPGMTGPRLDDRRQILLGLDRFKRETDARGSMSEMDAFASTAFEMMSGTAVRQAFDLAAEEPRLRDRYGRTRLGQSCLLARRLIEAGVTFVNVNDYEFMEWDLHGAPTATTVEKGTALKGPHLDAALSTLLIDLQQRNLLDRVLIQVFGEFGRTPKLNPAGGRDHWGNVFSVLLAGGGLRHGQVIGSSDSSGAVPHDRPLRPADLLATTYRVLGISPHLSPVDYAGRPVPLLPSAEPIRELFA